MAVRISHARSSQGLADSWLEEATGTTVCLVLDFCSVSGEQDSFSHVILKKREISGSRTSAGSR